MKNLQNTKDRAEIIGRLRAVRKDTPRLWGKMNASQMICHLSDTFRGIRGEIKIAPRDSFFRRVVMKRLMMFLPATVTVKNYPTFSEIDQQIGGTRPTDFAADLAELERLLAEFVDEKSDFTKWSHPLLGRMSRRQWSRWAYVHINHHLRQFGR
jgi:hypothetical protein